MNHDFVIKENNKGFGVYTKKSYKKGDTICQMSGQQNSLKELILNFGYEYENTIIDPLQIGPRSYVAMDKPYSLINHSCEPNAAITGINTLMALRNIKKGEELLYDYSTTIDESFHCKCGSKKCRHAVADFFALPEKTQKFYVKQKAVPDFVLKKYNRLHQLPNKSLRIGIVAITTDTKKVLEIQNKLSKLGHDTFIAYSSEKPSNKKTNPNTIKEFWRLMQDADATLVLNFHEKNIKKQTVADILIKVGLAHVLSQKIFFYSPITETEGEYFQGEMETIKPVVINGNLGKIQ